jgi:tRNA modification GTPase
MFQQWDDTIAALATPQGIGALGVIRVSGKDAILITNKIFSKDITEATGHSLHVGYIKNQDLVVDEVVISIFRHPASYTGEDVVEISCHGSAFILQEVLQLLYANGARPALPGEFTQRAFLNGKKDLSQAEAVADLIAAENKAIRDTALKQMRGGVSNDIKKLRQQLIEFAALIELELDFSQEDVEFAERSALDKLITDLLSEIRELAASFKIGNIIKEGVSVVIAGRPNAGKSTLLNALLNEERAIVTDIAGTTRDAIEEKMILDGIIFRITDTAGIRKANDTVEQLGINKTYEKISTAQILLYLFDISTATAQEVTNDLHALQIENQQIALLANKTDQLTTAAVADLLNEIRIKTGGSIPIFDIAALHKTNLDTLKEWLPKQVLIENIDADKTIVVNARHYSALLECETALAQVKQGLDNQITGDILALDIRHALSALGSITGEILHDRDILGTIFGKFCIGK